MGRGDEMKRRRGRREPSERANIAFGDVSERFLDDEHGYVWKSLDEYDIMERKLV